MIYSGLLCSRTHATQLYNVHLHLFVLFERMGRIEFTCVAGLLLRRSVGSVIGVALLATALRVVRRAAGGMRRSSSSSSVCVMVAMCSHMLSVVLPVVHITSAN